MKGGVCPLSDRKNKPCQFIFADDYAAAILLALAHKGSDVSCMWEVITPSSLERSYVRRHPAGADILEDLSSPGISNSSRSCASVISSEYPRLVRINTTPIAEEFRI